MDKGVINEKMLVSGDFNGHVGSDMGGFGEKENRNEEDRKKYFEAKKDAKIVVYMDLDQKAREEVEKVDSCRDGHELFRIPKQRAGEKKDVTEVSCL